MNGCGEEKVFPARMENKRELGAYPSAPVLDIVQKIAPLALSREFGACPSAPGP